MIRHLVTRGHGNGTFAGAVKCMVRRGYLCAIVESSALASARTATINFCKNILKRKQV